MLDLKHIHPVSSQGLQIRLHLETVNFKICLSEENVRGVRATKDTGNTEHRKGKATWVWGDRGCLQRKRRGFRESYLTVDLVIRVPAVSATPPPAWMSCSQYPSKLMPLFPLVAFQYEDLLSFLLWFLNIPAKTSNRKAQKT